MGLGMALSLTILGALREIIGQGTIFEGIENLFGEQAKFLTHHIYHTDSSFLLFILPPGAFIGLGLLLAIKNRIDNVKNKATKSFLPLLAGKVSRSDGRGLTVF